VLNLFRRGHYIDSIELLNEYYKNPDYEGKKDELTKIASDMCGVIARLKMDNKKKDIIKTIKNAWNCRQDLGYIATENDVPTSKNYDGLDIDDLIFLYKNHGDIKVTEAFGEYINNASTQNEKKETFCDFCNKKLKKDANISNTQENENNTLKNKKNSGLDATKNKKRKREKKKITKNNNETDSNENKETINEKNNKQSEENNP